MVLLLVLREKEINHHEPPPDTRAIKTMDKKYFIKLSFNLTMRMIITMNKKKAQSISFFDFMKENLSAD